MTRERLVEKPVERNIQKTKSEVKPILLTPQTMREVNRKKVIERCLPKGAVEYEMLLIQMEEGTLCESPKPADGHLMLEESSMNKLTEKSPKSLLKETPKVLFKESLRSVDLKESPNNFSKKSPKPVILKESPQAVVLPTKETVSRNDDQKQQATYKITKSLTMEDLGLLGGDGNKQAESSYESSH